MVLEEDSVVPAPTAMSDEQAATLSIASLTAWFALVDYGHLQAADATAYEPPSDGPRARRPGVSA
jgi:NADPH:quinone reductase-like Zn-dependent oxidoreductase